MEDKIIKVEEELSTMSVNLKNGTKIPVKAKTINTYWTSGRKDCEIQILEPINSVAKTEK